MYEAMRLLAQFINRTRFTDWPTRTENVRIGYAWKANKTVFMACNADAPYPEWWEHRP